MTKIWEFRGNKNLIRELALPNRPITNGIWLPRKDWLCTTLALRRGLLARAKNIIAVERERKAYEAMCNNAPAHPAIRCIHIDLSRLSLPCKIDYAYLDFYGGLKVSECLWMANELSSHLVSDATIAITQIMACRASVVVPAIRNLLSDRVYRRTIAKMYEDYDGQLSIHLKSRLLLLHSIFRNWDFEIEPGDDQHADEDYGTLPVYRDVTHRMVLFKLVDFKPKKRPFFPTLESVLQAT